MRLSLSSDSDDEAANSGSILTSIILKSSMNPI
jgi:hypothetical protein